MQTFATLYLVTVNARRWGHMDGWGGGWMWLWGTLMMFTWVALITGAIWLIARGRTDKPTQWSTSKARDILDERYAKGELSTEEYRERLAQLQRPGPEKPQP